MQTVTTVLFTALILGFVLLFLTPGRWWPRKPRRRPPPPVPQPERDEPEVPEPRRYTGYLN
jgi:hypothetical protein